MKSVLAKTDQRDFHGYCCYLQIIFFRKMLEDFSSQIAFSFGRWRGVHRFEMGMAKGFYDTLLLRSAIKQLGAPAEVGLFQNKMDEGRASNSKRDAKLTQKLIYKGRNLHQGAI